MKLKILTILAASLTISTGASANLIDNGDFSNGFTGFSSQYTLSTDLQPEGTYTVGSDPSAYHPQFVSVTGDNPMLLANGAPASNPNLVLLGYQGTVTDGGYYAFSASVMNICCKNPFGAPSTLEFQIRQGNDPFAKIAEFSTTPPTDAGVQKTAVSLSPFFLQAGIFDFRIIDSVTTAGGNDFAVDNLSIEAAAVPGPIVGAGFPGLLMALGGLVVLARRRRATAA
jgi:hypothetical protein